MVCGQLVVVGAIKTLTHTLIIGAGGMLGHDLMKAFPDAVPVGHREIDITDRGQVLRVIAEHKPRLVINAAAYTNVDGCEDAQELAYDVNGRGPGYLAEACAAAGATLVHYSTDYIFDGSSQAYVESDAANPINVYGQSKLLGEQNIARATGDYRIIRTSWLFGSHGKNFVDTMLTLSKQMERVRVVNDQMGKPTYTVDLAAKTREVIGMSPGIYHITNDGICSWYEFASAIIPNTVPCTSEEFARKARRPQYSVLTNTKTSPMRHWRDALAAYLSERGV